MKRHLSAVVIAGKKTQFTFLGARGDIYFSSISLWTTQKKKPIFTHALAHGFYQFHSATEGLIETPRWITSITSLPYSDLIASGSWDGDVRIWKLDSSLKSFSLIGTVPAPGVVNSLQVLAVPDGAFAPDSWARQLEGQKKKNKVGMVLLVAGLGQEHRLGRWMTLKNHGVVNGTLAVAFHPRTLA